MNIKEGNRLIAKFMGGTSGDGIGGLVFSWCKEGHPPIEPICHEKHLQYHSSWDWLMPVVEKIEALNITVYDDEIKYFAFTIQNKYCIIMGHTNVRQPGCYYQTPYGFVPDSKIHAAWIGVIEFVEWYNKNAEIKNVQTDNDVKCGVGEKNRN